MDIEKLFYAGATMALRRRVEAYKEIAKQGTTVIGRSTVYSAEAEIAFRQARAMEGLADEFEAEAGEKAMKLAKAAIEAPPAETETAPVPISSPAAMAVAEARIKGYEGEACTQCNNFTLIRNGTCLKCDTCGATTGCS